MKFFSMFCFFSFSCVIFSFQQVSAMGSKLPAQGGFTSQQGMTSQQGTTSKNKSSAQQSSNRMVVPSAATAPLWEAKRSDGHSWTNHVLVSIDILGKNLIDSTPRDILSFCPKYNNLGQADRKDFWIFLLSAIASRENESFNPTSSYRENFKNTRGQYIVSRGLLQISLDSGNAYGCGFRKEIDLNQPTSNLDCGLRIMDQWIKKDNVISGGGKGAWLGLARYWSVLRASNPGYNAIKNLAQNNALCAK